MNPIGTCHSQDSVSFFFFFFFFFFQWQRTPLHIAADCNKIEAVAALISHGADVNARDKDQCTPLHAAAVNNEIEAVAALISHGADVNAREEDGETPLMYASCNGRAKVVEALLDAGADKELKATRGRWKGKTALDIARDENEGAVVAVLERR